MPPFGPLSHSLHRFILVQVIAGIYGFLVGECAARALGAPFTVLTQPRPAVFWGAAIVIFLLKIINFHNANTQGFWVEVSSQIECGEPARPPTHSPFLFL